MALDRSQFRPEAIDPDTAAFNTQLEALLATQTSIHLRQAWEIREERASGKGPAGPIIRSPNAKERQIDGPAGPITLRTFVPERVDGVYLHIHGGGWAIGAADQQDPRLDALATATNVAILSVEYRLAPEHPYPAGPDDCEAAALWLVKNAKAEFGSERLVIGGESAGAHLAVVSLVRLRDRYGLRPFSAANLNFGVYDLDGTPSSRNWGDRNLILSTPIMQWFADQYVPPARRREPDVSPIYADLAGLPKALFSVGTADPLLDDSLFMHARWLAAGNEAELAVFPGAVHGFINYPLPPGRASLAQQEAFVRDSVASASRV